MNIHDIRARIAEQGTDGLAVEVRAANDAKYGEGNQPPLTDAQQAAVDYYRDDDADMDYLFGSHHGPSTARPTRDQLEPR